jgi:hypothetical protein
MEASAAGNNIQPGPINVLTDQTYWECASRMRKQEGLQVSEEKLLR